MNAMRRAEPPDLAHRRVRLARLDVGDAHVDAAVELRQLMAERRGAQVAADAGKLAFFVAEGGFDHEVRDLHAAQPLPQRRVGAGVTGEDPVLRIKGRCRPFLLAPLRPESYSPTLRRLWSCWVARSPNANARASGLFCRASTDAAMALTLAKRRSGIRSKSCASCWSVWGANHEHHESQGLHRENRV